MGALLGVLAPYSDLITSIATIVIAVFTIVLAFVTNRQARLTRQALITTERAFVFLEDFVPGWIFQDAKPQQPRPQGTVPATEAKFTELIVKPRWRNNGTTPTRNMRVQVNWTHFSGQLPKGFSFEYGSEPRKMFLGPQAIEWSDAINIPPHVATDALHGRTKIYIWGRVDYDDIFDETPAHHTRWCYQLRLALNAVQRPESQFVSESDYNGSDEDTNI